jgi:hypothetical protein
MKTKLISISLSMFWILAACQPGTSLPPVVATLDNEFTLGTGQSVSVKKTDLTITFNAVLSDERCPSEIECAASGPVTVSLSVQQDGDLPFMVTLQTFTDQGGRAPNGSLKGSKTAFMRLLNSSRWRIALSPEHSRDQGI